MSVKGVEAQCFILALFIRNDGERLLLGDGMFQFKEGQKHFVANSVSNSTIDVQGADGVLLAGQTRRAAKQSFDGYIGDATVTKEDIEQNRRDFISFFKTGIESRYEVVYIFPDGSAIKRQRGFLVDAPSVEEFWQIHPEYHVALNFEDVNYYTYNEDAEGNELYGQSANILLYNAVTGGFPYDDRGLIWDNLGAVCYERLGGTTTLNINSIEIIYPVWTVTGPADNPRLINHTTDMEMQYNGRVAPGQTLVIDTLNQTALLDGVNVLNNVTGDWVNFVPGINIVDYITDNANALSSNIKWQEIVA